MDNMNLGLAIVKNTIGSIEKEPRFDTELADEAIHGMIVKLLKKAENNWFFVETSYGYNGYMHESDLYIDSEKAIKWDEQSNNIISHGIVDVMKEPKFQSYPIMLLTRGAIVKTTGEINDQWIEIMLPDERKGWVRKDFVKERIRLGTNTDEDTLRNNVVKTALSYLGTQYRWGGKTTLGIDCSGLCSISYLLNGIIIYRDANIKEEYHMRAISREEMKPGDLMYWTGHVAMYIGNDKYVHSTGKSSGVVINSLNPKDADFREDLVNIKQMGTVF